MGNVCTLSVDFKQPFSLFFFLSVDILNNPTQEHWDSCTARGYGMCYNLPPPSITWLQFIRPEPQTTPHFNFFT
jgi:hypothetical protein